MSDHALTAIVGASDAVVRVADQQRMRVVVVPMSGGVSALTLPGCLDMKLLFELALLVAANGPAIVLACIPDEMYQAAWVVRPPEKTYAFLAIPGTRLPVPSHLAGIGESHVAKPIAEALAFAGFNADDLDVCQAVGKHKHG